MGGYPRPLVIQCYPNGCHEVISHRTLKEGYPVLGRKDTDGICRTISVARIIWEDLRGPIPKGIYVCHTCDNHWCVNPEHLFLGTQKENMEDCVRKGRQAKGEKLRQTKLTRKDVRAIRKSKGSSCAVAPQYGVSSSQILRIRRRENWAWLDKEAA